MIDALAAGRLFKSERRTAKSGAAYILATLRLPDGDSAQFVRAMAFEGSPAFETLAAVHEGEAVTVTGGLKADAYTKDGEARAALTIMATGAIAARPERMARARERGRRKTHEQASVG